MYQKNCPSCDRLQSYATEKGLKVAIKKNRICKFCSNKEENNPQYGKSPSEKTRELLKIANTGKIRSEETKEKLRNNGLGEKNPMFGRKGELCPSYQREWSQDSRDKLSAHRKNLPLSTNHRNSISEGLKGKTHSEETRKKMRISRINHIIENNGGIKPSINKRGFHYFTNLESENNWDGFFGFKNKEYYIKELGYFLDYYEPNLNIAIEYDEPLHYNTDNTLKERDIIRMNMIKSHLNCRFFRYNEKTKELIEY